MDNGKIDRVLGIYTKLMNGSLVNKAEEAQNYSVNERSIQRDIDDIRTYLDNQTAVDGMVNSIIYDRNQKAYRLEQIYNLKFTNPEILAICKILLDSRAFCKDEMQGILDKLNTACVPKANQKFVKEILSNEVFHYVEPRHKTKFLEIMWEIAKAANEHRYIEIEYERKKDNAVVTRKVKPAAIMFSEYYFYLTAFIENEDVRKDFDVINDTYPTIYRIDRIKELSILDEHFRVPYNSRFEEGEFRKRVQFMYGGKIQRVRFDYSGTDVDAILDRLPTAQIISEESGKYSIKAEVFGKGIDMWFRSQGDMISNIQYT